MRTALVHLPAPGPKESVTVAIKQYASDDLAWL
jgi:hypothetical protein